MLAEIIPDRLDVTLNQQLTLKALLIRLSFVTILVAVNDACQDWALIVSSQISWRVIFS